MRRPIAIARSSEPTIPILMTLRFPNSLKNR
jgi:hypothetical protein